MVKLSCLLEEVEWDPPSIMHIAEYEWGCGKFKSLISIKITWNKENYLSLQ